MKAFFCLAVVALIATAACAAPVTEEQYEFLFTRFVEQYGKQYEVEHFFAKYNTFKSNLNSILAHNSKNLSFTLAMNEFGDMTNTEFKAKMNKLKPTNNFYARSHNTADFSKYTIPAENGAALDWRKKGAVTPIKNQGQCGSCWAFSATGSIEGAWAIKKGALVSVSEQQLVDCAGSTGNQGCNGGLMDQAFEWVIQNGGICSEQAYPYTAMDGTCKTCSPVVTISGYKNVAAVNEGELMKAVNLVPVSIAIEADQSAFQFYSGGVFNAACGTQLDHGVLVAGYGTDSSSNLDYWLVKNSWGTSWGEAGYIRMVRNKNECGLANQPVYATV